MVGKLVRQGIEIDLRLYCSYLEQGLYLGCEVQAAVSIVYIIERLYTKTVASEKKLILAFVPNGEGKHSAKMFDTVAAIFVIEVQYRFGIAAVLKNVSAWYQFVAAFCMVVD